VIDEVGGRARHAPGAATRTHGAPLAGERHDEIPVTGLTLGAQEAMRVDAAFQVRAEISLDVFRKTPFVLVADVSEVRFEVLRDDAVEHGVLWAVLFVPGGSSGRCGLGHERRGATSVPARDPCVAADIWPPPELSKGRRAGGGRHLAREEQKASKRPAPEVPNFAKG